MIKEIITNLLRRDKLSNEFVEKIKEILSVLDYEPKLEIVSFDMPLSKLIILADGKSSRPRNPTYYIINSSHEDLINMPISLMVRYCARAVRCRRQSGENKLEHFVSVYFKVTNERLKTRICYMDLNTYGNYDADAQVVALVAEDLYLESYSLENISEMILMDASQIIEDFEIR